MVQASDIYPCIPVDTKEKIIIYTGTLARQYRAIDLVEAFGQIRAPEYRLVVCCEREAEDEFVYCNEFTSTVDLTKRLA